MDRVKGACSNWNHQLLSDLSVLAAHAQHVNTAPPAGPSAMTLSITAWFPLHRQGHRETACFVFKTAISACAYVDEAFLPSQRSWEQERDHQILEHYR
ncbi:hypothetical protein [Daeguia caeni]|uniref:hypothetical protein n=1 Tax=Daeguia caeni TaxID=439612 RepID=UPI0035BC3064